MKAGLTNSGSEVFLGIIALRLAVVGLAGLALSVLPERRLDCQSVCQCVTPLRSETSASIRAAPEVEDEALKDMRLHD
jgi:hypothetical protein